MYGVLFDLDGVLYQGDQPLDGAADAVRWCIDKRVPHLFLTNTTSRPRSALLAKLCAMGIPARERQLLTPAVAARNWIQRHQPGTVALFVPEGTAAEFAGVPLAGPDEIPGAVVIGDLGEGWDFTTLNRVFRLLMGTPQPRLIALGMTRYWRSADGLRLDVGAFASALSFAAAVEPLITGKPAPGYFAAALELLGISADQTVMVGDDIIGDIRGAQQAGIAALLVRTGKFQESDLTLGISPQGVLDSVQALPAWLARWQECG